MNFLGMYPYDKQALVHPSRLSSLFFLSQNTLTLDIPLLSRVVFHASSAHAVLEVGRRDHWRGLGQGEGRELSVVRAVLRGVVVHRGFRYVMSTEGSVMFFLS
jgi:hypothetical protein